MTLAVRVLLTRGDALIFKEHLFVSLFLIG